MGLTAGWIDMERSVVIFFSLREGSISLDGVVNTTAALSAGRQGPCRPVFKKKIARLVGVGRLGSGPCLVVDSADVVPANRVD